MKHTIIVILVLAFSSPSPSSQLQAGESESDAISVVSRETLYEYLASNFVFRHCQPWLALGLAMQQQSIDRYRQCEVHARDLIQVVLHLRSDGEVTREYLFNLGDRIKVFDDPVLYFAWLEVASGEFGDWQWFVDSIEYGVNVVGFEGRHDSSLVQEYIDEAFRNAGRRFNGGRTQIHSLLDHWFSIAEQLHYDSAKRASILTFAARLATNSGHEVLATQLLRQSIDEFENSQYDEIELILALRAAATLMFQNNQHALAEQYTDRANEVLQEYMDESND